MAPTAALLSFRLGGADGVSVEARKWAGALEDLGFTVRRVAGELEGDEPDDVVVPGLAIAPPDDVPPPAPHLLAEALDGADLVVVENVCSLPLNLEASRAVATALHEHHGRVLFHHHDLPWQRRELAALDGEFPPRVDGALHVTINLRSRRDLAARGIAATAIHNRFDFDAPPGDPRGDGAAALGFADDELVVLQPGRAIPRKNVPGAMVLLTELSRRMPGRRLRYWLTGPAEDGYGPTLERVLARAPVPVTQGRAPTAADAYAACDLVAFPSTWEGFGNPTIESVIARRPAAVRRYPVLAEIVAHGIKLFDIAWPEELARFLAHPDPLQLEANLTRARPPFGLEGLAPALDDAFRRARLDGLVSDGAAPDPVAERRRRIARAVGIAKRVGYAALLVSIVAFVAAFATGLPAALLTVGAVALVVACLVLPVPIVLGYGVRAAERDDRARAARPAPPPPAEGEPTGDQG